MTRKVTLAAAIVTFVTVPLAFAIEAGASQATPDQSRTTATKSINASVSLYEKGDMAGNHVCTLKITSAPFSEMVNFQKDSYGCANDEAVSILFSNIPAGSIISLYNDPHCGENDDWVKFTFFSEVSSTYAHDFEINQTKTQNGVPVFKQEWVDRDNLNGKVSCINIHVPEPH